MAHKILVADDSQTIQKVVQITLGNSGHILVRALNVNELEENLKRGGIDLLLLDYNLSEDVTVKDVVQKVKAINADVPILMMLGTFDSMSDQELKSLGIQDKITKPFESAKFSHKIDDLLSRKVEAKNDESLVVVTQGEDIVVKSEVDELIETVKVIDPEENQRIDQDISNIVTTNEVVATKQKEKEKIKTEELVRDSSPEALQKAKNFLFGGVQEVKKERVDFLSPLEEELLSWEMSVPGVIGKKGGSPILPSVISKKNKLDQDISEISGKVSIEEDRVVEMFPDGGDLEYPSLASGASTDKSGPTSKLIPINDLKITDETPEEVSVKVETSTALQEDILAEISPEVFWSSDQETEERDTGLGFDHEATARIDLSKLQEIVKEKKPKKIQGLERDDVEAMLKKMVEESVRAYMKESIERVAWEVIPDLAENLIREQLKEITKSVD